MDIVFIYSLDDPITNEPKYIGKAKCLKTRLYTHTAKANLKHKTPKSDWIKKLLSVGLKPVITLIDSVPFEQWQFWEKHYISLYKSWGFKLKNSTIGGDGNNSPTRSDEFKKRVSKTLRARFLGKPVYQMTDEIKQKMSNSQKEMYRNGRISNITSEISKNAREVWKKKIIQFDSNYDIVQEFESIREAANFLCKKF